MNLPLSEITFSYARSSGPGGQNVNKVNSKAILHWNIVDTYFLNDFTKKRFLILFQNHINSDGFLIISSDQFRDQKKNVNSCLDKLKAMIHKAATPPKIRKKTKVSKGAKERRLASKKKHSLNKAHRQSKRVKEY